MNVSEQSFSQFTLYNRVITLGVFLVVLSYLDFLFLARFSINREFAKRVLRNLLSNLLPFAHPSPRLTLLLGRESLLSFFNLRTVITTFGNQARSDRPERERRKKKGKRKIAIRKGYVGVLTRP